MSELDSIREQAAFTASIETARQMALTTAITIEAAALSVPIAAS